ncbi:MAG TPA: glutamine amidotransferase [Vicinamibacterales bacterium]|nr:glutamine amidotransferase [Vicinamibacterales bacterium]
MRFAVVLPWWGYLLAAGAALVLGWLAYARVPVKLTAGQRLGLSGLRALTLLLLTAILLRPVVMVPPAAARNSVLPILVDVSRSMRLTDTGSGSRLDDAKTIVRNLYTQLGSEYRIELLTFGDVLAAATDIDRLDATARRSDLTGAIADLAARYPVAGGSAAGTLAGVIVLSDGGDTAPIEAGRTGRLNAPLFTIGVGNPDSPRDREVVNLTAGEALLPGASIDVSVSATSHGYGTEPVELRISANGRPLEVRRVTPAADGAPLHAIFTVSPERDVATVYTVQIPETSGEVATENNTRSVLVPPQAGRRRLLVVEGAPGYEHTFLKRALADDPGLDIDAVVRKGQNDDGRDTFYVQADPSRMAALSSGYPFKRSELFAYDGVIFGNIEADFFTREQLELTNEFVATRGGGLLVLGARSFERQGLMGTALEQALPIDLADRRSSITLASAAAPVAEPNTAALTIDGVLHPATRLAVTPDDNRQKWASLPALASVAPIGGTRPGAQVLAVALTAGGTPQPLIAAQRYGQGRSLIFAGEASWRWRMMKPADDTSYETIWRQLARWITAGSQGPVTIAPLSPAAAGITERISVSVRDEDYRPVPNAEVVVELTAPNGDKRQATAALSSPQDGKYGVATRFDQNGVYRVAAIATRAGVRIGTASRPVLVGGVDLEMTQPRLNDAVLRRLAAESQGRYLSRDEVGQLPSLLRASRAEAGTAEMRDVWHNGWSLLVIIGLLAAEWVARRRVGLA